MNDKKVSRRNRNDDRGSLRFVSQLLITFFVVSSLLSFVQPANAQVACVVYGHISYNGTPVDGAVVYVVEDVAATDVSNNGGFYTVTTWASFVQSGGHLNASYNGRSAIAEFTVDGGEINVNILPAAPTPTPTPTPAPTPTPGPVPTPLYVPGTVGPAFLPIATSLPHALNTTYYEKLVNDTINPNLTTTMDNVENGTIIGDIKMEYDWAVFSGDQSMFWMILYGVPALLLFWRARSPFLPCSAFLIMTPIVWPYVSGNWQMGIIVVDLFAMVGVVYAFFISIKRT